jgi:hypothetical protein
MVPSFMFVGPIVAWLSASSIAPVLDGSAPYANGAPAAWNATNMAVSNSAAPLLTLPAGRGIQTVVYDAEPALTPANDIANIAQAETAVCASAHRIGAKCILTPSGPAGYLQTALDTGCRVGDGVDLQNQLAETNLPYFSGLVHQEAARCRSFNPAAEIIVGITTRYGKTTSNATPVQIESAIASVSDVANRYWFNVPQPGRACPDCGPFSPSIAAVVIQHYAALR